MTEEKRANKDDRFLSMKYQFGVQGEERNVLSDLGVFRDGQQIRPVCRDDMLSLSKLNGGKFDYLRLQGLDMRKIDMRGLHIENAYLIGVDLEGAIAMPMVTLDTGDLPISDMAYEMVLDRWSKGETEQFVQHVTPTILSGSLLSQANLSNADFRWGGFRSTFMVRTVLQKADLSYADLTKANLKWAKLEESRLQFANMENACLEQARIVDTDLEHAILKGADLAGVSISTGCNLEWVEWGQNYISVLESRGDYQGAIALYRHLKELHDRAGMSSIAGKFHYREREAARKAEWQRLGQDFKDYKRHLAAAWRRFKGQTIGE